MRLTAPDHRPHPAAFLSLNAYGPEEVPCLAQTCWVRPCVPGARDRHGNLGLDLSLQRAGWLILHCSFEPTMATDEIHYISMSKSGTFDIQCDVKVILKGGDGIHWEGEKLVLPETKAGRHAEGAWTFSFEHAML